MDPAEISQRYRLEDIDRVPVRPAPRWMRRFWHRDVGAMTLPWAIYIRPALLSGDRSVLARLVRHELVHVRQWFELGWWRFLTRYLAEYWRLRRSGLGHQAAYEDISFEREARALAGN